LLLTSKLLNQGFLLVKLKSSLWLGWPLWNICVTNVHGYVPLGWSSQSNLLFPDFIDIHACTRML
jgi:hypothetical protein